MEEIEVKVFVVQEERYIKGLEKLNDKQKEILFTTNERHKNTVGNDYKDGITITEVWIEKGIVCARLKNGDWYHYNNGCWY